MHEMWTALEAVEREILATAVGESARLEELMGRRGALIQALSRALEKETCGPLTTAERASAYDRLLAHYASGQALGDRLRQERGRVVDAWGESTRERQLMHLLAATRGEPARDGVRRVAEMG